MISKDQIADSESGLLILLKEAGENNEDNDRD